MSEQLLWIQYLPQKHRHKITSAKTPPYHHKKNTTPPQKTAQKQHHTSSKTPLFVRTLCVRCASTPSVTSPAQLHAELQPTCTRFHLPDLQTRENPFGPTIENIQNMAAPSKNQPPPHVQLCFRFIGPRRCIVFPKFLGIPGSVLQEFSLLHTTFQRSSDTKCIIIGRKAFGLRTRTWLSQRISRFQRLECLQAHKVCQTWSRIEFCQILSLAMIFSTIVHEASSF